MNLETVSDYINSLDGNAKTCITDFVNYMETEFPGLTPRISFSMPMWWMGPKMYHGYIAVSSAKKHYSIHFGEEGYILKLREQLTDCSFGKRCINVKYGDEHALSIVKQNIKDYLKDFAG